MLGFGASYIRDLTVILVSLASMDHLMTCVPEACLNGMDMNYIQQYVGCDYLPVHVIPASGTQVPNSDKWNILRNVVAWHFNSPPNTLTINWLSYVESVWGWCSMSKIRSRDICALKYLFGLSFDTFFGSSIVDMPNEFHSDMIISAPNLLSLLF